MTLSDSEGAPKNLTMKLFPPSSVASAIDPKFSIVLTCSLSGLICNSAGNSKCEIQIGSGTDCNVACSADGSANHKGEVCEGGDAIVSKAVWATHARSYYRITSGKC